MLNAKLFNLCVEVFYSGSNPPSHNSCPTSMKTISVVGTAHVANVACHNATTDHIHNLQYLELNKTETNEHSSKPSDEELDRTSGMILKIADEEIKPIRLEDNVSLSAINNSINSVAVFDTVKLKARDQNNLTNKEENMQDLKLTSKRMPLTTTATTIILNNNISTTTSVAEDRRVQCYSCGSLFSSVSSDCEIFNSQDERQRVTCGQGEACLFYAWRSMGLFCTLPNKQTKMEHT